MGKPKATRLKRNIDLLRALKRANPKRRAELLGVADDDLVICLCECCRNVLDANIPLTYKQKSLLKKKHLPTIRTLGNFSVPLEQKKELVQEGGYIGALLPALLGPVLSAVTGLLT